MTSGPEKNRVAAFHTIDNFLNENLIMVPCNVMIPWVLKANIGWVVKCVRNLQDCTSACAGWAEAWRWRLDGQEVTWHGLRFWGK
jgi:hypothetical protein